MTKRKQPEALARIRINNALVGLGWRLDAEGDRTANVTLEGELRNPADSKKLGRARPDYVLYAEGSDIPIGIIEAKKPRYSKMADALEQARKYAEKLKYRHMVVFASDGNVTLAEHVTGASLTINNERVDDFVPSAQLTALAKSPWLEEGKAVENMATLIALFDSVSNDLRKDGVEAGMDALKEFCLVLFVKIMSEKGKALPGCKWEQLIDGIGDDLLENYKQIVEKYRGQFGDIFAEMKIRRAQTLEQIVQSLNDINFHRSSFDVKGGAYEYFLSKYSAGRKSVLGQYFTPRHITRMMAQLLNLSKSETVYDPFCGTGGMLVACYGLMRNQVQPGDSAELKTLNNHTLFGRDITETASRLAKMNMIVLGDGHSNIKCVDSINEPVNGKYDAVITNIPFNLEPSEMDVAIQYGSTSSDSNELCVRHCMQAVKKGGKAAIVLPENIAYADKYQSLRQHIRKNAEIRAVIQLPDATFNAYTAARTFVLLLSNIWEKQTVRFPVVTISADGYSSARNREPILENDIPALLGHAGEIDKHYPQEDTSDDFKFFADTEQSPSVDLAGTWALREVLDVVTDKQELQSGKIYYEPRLSGSTNTVAPKGKDGRLGMNIKGGKKVLTEPGDLIISTLHTQNGLFAYCDRQYVTTSQIVAKVKESMVSKSYLAYTLRKVLPALSKRDLVGREGYKSEKILSLRIPKPTPALLKAFVAADKETTDTAEKLQQAIKKEEKSLSWPQ